MIRRFSPSLIIWLGGLVSFGNASGQPKPPSGNPMPCNQGVCTLTITVNGDCRQPGNISIDKPFVLVDAFDNMRWVIATPGHEFTANGIAFDPPNPQFEVKNSSARNEFRVHNK